jgi:hypothetical protein
MRTSIVCPETGNAFYFEVKSDAKSVASSWRKSLQVACPHCRDFHTFQFRNVYMEGALSGFREDFDHWRTLSRAPLR